MIIEFSPILIEKFGKFSENLKLFAAVKKQLKNFFNLASKKQKPKVIFIGFYKDLKEYKNTSGRGSNRFYQTNKIAAALNSLLAMLYSDLQKKTK